MSLELTIKTDIFKERSKFLIVKESPVLLDAYILPEHTTFLDIKKEFKLSEESILGGASYEFEGKTLWIDGFSPEYGSIPQRVGITVGKIIAQVARVNQICITTQQYQRKNQALWDSLEG